MQVVFSGVGDVAVNLLDAGFRLRPVTAEFDLAAHAALILGEALLMLLETVKRRDETAVAQGSKTRNADIDADSRGRRGQGLLYLALGLDRHIPLAAVARHGDVLRRAKRVLAVAVANPAQLGQEHAAVTGVDLELLGIRVAEAIAHALFLEAREVGAFGKEVFVGPLKVFQRVLQRMYGSLRQPSRIGAVAPGGE